MCNTWIRLFCTPVLLLFVNINLHDRLLCFKITVIFLALYFKIHVIVFYLPVKPQMSSYFYSFTFIELGLTFAIWFVSTVTERANQARDHLIKEAILDKYDGWVLTLLYRCCFQALNICSSLRPVVDPCLFMLLEIHWETWHLTEHSYFLAFWVNISLFKSAKYVADQQQTHIHVWPPNKFANLHCL